MYDDTTAGLALTRFKFTLTRPRTLPVGDYNDFDYGFSTYNTQMYMGYNEDSTTTGENLRFWDGDTSSSPTAVDFDQWNQETTTLTVDGALAGLFTVPASVMAAAAVL